jgi:hypothetical protein
MDRRAFIGTLAGGLLAAPLAAEAQQVKPTARVGILRYGSFPPSFIEPFRQELRELGYVEGQSIVVEYRIAQSVAQLPDVAAELIRLKVDVLVASGNPSVLPARNATSTDPGGVRGRHRSCRDGAGREPRPAARKRDRREHHPKGSCREALGGGLMSYGPNRRVYDRWQSSLEMSPPGLRF